MAKISYEIVREAAQYVKDFLKENLPEHLVFHTEEHAEYVAQKAELIGRHSRLEEDELNLVILSAWFHDTGYTAGFEDHEVRSVRIASDFLKGKDIDNATIDQVRKCILATRIPQKPDDLLSKVLCDADMAHLAEDDYFLRLEKLRKERSNLLNNKIGKRKCLKNSVRFFQEHRYFTEYAQEVLQPEKERNLHRMNDELYELKKKKKARAGKSKKNARKLIAYSRGVESMFRNMARMQINLSSIADNKSNILISVNAIVISITMTVLVSRFEEIPGIIAPTLIFVSFSVVTIIFAILSTRPQISSGVFTKDDIKKTRVNLLFFGNFYNMGLDDYEWAVEEIMKDDRKLYRTMIRDQYSLGKVLAKKYKLLRVAYNFFMIGIILSVLAFVLAFTGI